MSGDLQGVLGESVGGFGESAGSTLGSDLWDLQEATRCELGAPFLPFFSLSLFEPHSLGCS